MASEVTYPTNPDALGPMLDELRTWKPLPVPHINWPLRTDAPFFTPAQWRGYGLLVCEWTRICGGIVSVNEWWSEHDMARLRDATADTYPAVAMFLSPSFGRGHPTTADEESARLTEMTVRVANVFGDDTDLWLVIDSEDVRFNERHLNALLLAAERTGFGHDRVIVYNNRARHLRALGWETYPYVAFDRLSVSMTQYSGDNPGYEIEKYNESLTRSPRGVAPWLSLAGRYVTEFLPGGKSEHAWRFLDSPDVDWPTERDRNVGRQWTNSWFERRVAAGDQRRFYARRPAAVVNYPGWGTHHTVDWERAFPHVRAYARGCEVAP